MQAVAKAFWNTYKGRQPYSQKKLNTREKILDACRTCHVVHVSRRRASDVLPSMLNPEKLVCYCARACAYELCSHKLAVWQHYFDGPSMEELAEKLFATKRKSRRPRDVTGGLVLQPDSSDEDDEDQGEGEGNPLWEGWDEDDLEGLMEDEDEEEEEDEGEGGGEEGWFEDEDESGGVGGEWTAEERRAYDEVWAQEEQEDEDDLEGLMEDEDEEEEEDEGEGGGEDRDEHREAAGSESSSPPLEDLAESDA